MAISHVLVIPYPLQGHVLPLMEFARHLAKEGIKVTFVNTEAIHKVLTSNLVEQDGDKDLLHMVSIPDGLDPQDDRKDYIKVLDSIRETMPSKLEELVEKINKEDINKVTCIVSDISVGWALRTGKKIGLKRVAYCTPAATTIATMICAQKWINDGILNNDGVPLTDDMLQLSETMPPIKPTKLVWMCGGSVAPPKQAFKYTKVATEGAMLAERIICDSSIELEPETFRSFPQLLPIGPLLASIRHVEQTGQFLQQDSSCLSWLDQQSKGSVIYVAFGSSTVFDQNQFEEIALGLELSNRPFLWVVRTGMTNESAGLPYGFVERVGSRVKIVSWAPQQKVLAHPSVGCFLSHCGWNSSLEGVTNGLPFLCLPYFTDQFLDEVIICDVWKTGLGFEKDEQGIITREEIKSEIERIFTDKSFKNKALELKEKVINSVQPGGSSYQNLCNIVDWIQGKEVDANW
ncbi:hypothetical protein LXL04_024154 [Taraxacum kok-saghyz]